MVPSSSQAAPASPAAATAAPTRPTPIAAIDLGSRLDGSHASSDPRFAAQFLTAKTKGCSTMMVVPLKSGDLVYGVLEVIDNRRGVPFTGTDLTEFAAITEITAVALERAYYFQAMRRMAETDQLTGIPNKRTFDRYMEREIEVCKRYGTPASVLTVTIDNLRRLNEDYGPSSVDKIIQMLAGVLAEVLAAAGIEPKDVDWVVPHQANLRIMQGTAKKLKLSADKVVVTVDQHGNTSAASIPLALDHAVRSGQVQRGQTLLLEGVGGGFTWGAVLVDY